MILSSINNAYRKESAVKWVYSMYRGHFPICKVDCKEQEAELGAHREGYSRTSVLFLCCFHIIPRPCGVNLKFRFFGFLDLSEKLNPTL